MLPKISAALVQFIPAIASSGKQVHGNGNKQNKDKKEFQKFKSEPEAKKSPNISPPIEKQPETTIARTSQLPVATGPDPGSVALAFITLFSMFQKRRTALSKWFGMRSYQVAAKEQKHIVKARKGAVVDDQAA